MTRLLNDRFAPITSEFGLVKFACPPLADWWVRRASVWLTPRGVTIDQTRVEGGLADKLRALLPLTSVERRRVLLVPLSSEWTAVFDNGWRGGDAAGLSVAASTLKTEAMRIVCGPGVGSAAPRVFELYGPDDTDFLNYVRTISVMKDGARWRFDESGPPLQQEDGAWLSPRTIKDRFTEEQLGLLLHRLGCEPFDETAYGLEGRLLELRGPVLPNVREYSLDQAQQGSPD